MSRRVLVLRALGLGDLLTAVPALRALRSGFPRHRLLLATPAPLADLALYTGAVAEVVPAGPLEPLPPGCAGADTAVNLHGRGPQSHRVLLAGRPGRLMAFANAAVSESAGGPAWREDEHEIERWCRLVAAHGMDADPCDLRLPAPPGARRDARVTLIHPGAASRSRRWPAERWAEVIAAERRHGRSVVVTGTPGERALCERIAGAGGLDRSAVAAGRTTVMQLLGLVAAAGRVVCGDTGVSHLATALGTPSVSLFGPTRPDRWGPPPGLGRHRVLWHGGEGDPHGAEVDPGLLRITVDEVLEALRAGSPGPVAHLR